MARSAAGRVTPRRAILSASTPVAPQRVMHVFYAKCQVPVSGDTWADTYAYTSNLRLRFVMPRSTPRTTDPQPTVLVRGRRLAYLERLRIGRRDYYLLERIGGPLRERFRAFAPAPGSGGDFFLVQRLRADEVSDQRLAVLRRLTDDGYPRVWEWRRDGHTVDVVLTWVEGVSLADYLANIRAGRRPPVDPAHALRLIHGLAAAVCKLHHKLQVVHGDIQPANIIVTQHPSRLVLVDFGSAWTSQQAAQRDEGDGHHRIYSAPELQLGAIATGFAADQFSVSVMFYELLTLQLPYGGLGGKAGRPEFIERTGDALAPPSSVRADLQNLPRSLRELLDRVVMRGLALVPEDRYPDRHAWLDALFEASARFRLPPSPSPVKSVLTRVIRRFVRPRGEA